MGLGGRCEGGRERGGPIWTVMGPSRQPPKTRHCPAASRHVTSVTGRHASPLPASFLPLPPCFTSIFILLKDSLHVSLPHFNPLLNAFPHCPSTSPTNPPPTWLQ